MPAELQYDFGVVNEHKLAQAFARVERRVMRHGRIVEARLRRIYSGAGLTGRGATTGGPAATARLYETRMRQAAKAQRSAAQSEERAQLRIQRQKEQADAKRIREQQRAERRAIAERERASRREATERRRQLAAETRERTRRRRERERAEKRHAHEVESTRRRYRQTVRGHVDRGLGAVSGVAGRAATMVGLAGAGLAAAGLYEGVGLQRRQQQLLVNARGAGEDPGMTQTDLGAKIRATAIAHAQSQGDVTAGLEEFVAKTGDLDAIVGSMDTLGTVATATGTSFEFIASAAADLFKKFDIRTPEQMAAAFTTLTMQGKKGAFELRNMAEFLPEIGAAASRFGLQGELGVKQLGGIAQIAMESAASPAEASTAVSRMFDALIENSKGLRTGKLLGTKVETFNEGDPTKGMRDIIAIMGDVMAAVGGDVTKFNEVFNIRAARAGSKSFVASQKAYQEVIAAGGSKKEARRAAGEATIRTYREAMEPGGAATFAELKQDEAAMLQTSDSKMQQLKDRFTESVQTKMLPVLERLLPKVEGLIEPFGKLIEKATNFAEWFAENPYRGVGALMAAAAVKDVAGAMIGQKISGALTSLITGIRKPALPGFGNGPATPATWSLGVGTALTIIAAGAVNIARHDTVNEEEQKLNTEGEKLMTRYNAAISSGNPAELGQVERDVENYFERRGEFLTDTQGGAGGGGNEMRDFDALRSRFEATRERARKRQEQQAYADEYGAGYSSGEVSPEQAQGFYAPEAPAMTSWADPSAPDMGGPEMVGPTVEAADLSGVEGRLDGVLRVEVTNAADIGGGGGGGGTGGTSGVWRKDTPPGTSAG